jgi:hypothetical protein
MSPNLYPGIRDEDVLLGCGEDTPELNSQVVEHAECSLRYLFLLVLDTLYHMYHLYLLY